MHIAALPRSSIRVTAAVALTLAAGCTAGRQADIAPAPVAGPCQSAQQELRAELRTLAVRADPAKRRSYASALSRMLSRCDAEVRSMPAPFADDWRARSYFVTREVTSLVALGDAEFAALLPEHRRRVERLLATYTGMFGNPPARRVERR